MGLFSDEVIVDRGLLLDTLIMVLKTIASVLFFTIPAFAKDAAPKQAAETRDEAQEKMKAPPGADASCFTCQFTMSAESAKEGQDKICDDLFGASCMGTDGKPKYQGRSKSLPQELAQPIREARDKTAKKMGFKDFDDALRSRLKKAGLDLKDPVDPKAWKNLKREGGGFTSGGDNAKNLYRSVEWCAKEVKEFKTIRYDGMSDVKQLRETVRKYDAFQRKYRELSTGLYAKDIPTFVSNHIAQKCKSLKSRPASGEHRQAAKACENFVQIKRQAVNLFRMEGTPQYKAQAEKFVRENLLLNPEDSPLSAPAPASQTPEKSEIDKLRERLQAPRNIASDYCSELSSVIENAGNKVFEQLADDINKTKTTVDSVIDSFYSDSKRKIATRMFQEARAGIQGIVSQFVKDPAKRGKILDGYDRLKLLWMEKPPESAYKRAEKGMMILDEDKTAPFKIFGDDVFATFSDPSLSFFTTLNANYMPSISRGEFNNAERINMMPAFIHSLDKNPYAFLTVIAHEAGHKIGPQASKINGHDLTPEYRELVACYGDNRSINMQKHQTDEAIADYISSEVLANQISKLPQDKRKQALMSSMEDFCIFDDASNHARTVSCRGVHPENSLRVGGIYGANPNLRKAIGCEGESPKFKSCGLKVSLSSASSNGNNGGNDASKPATPARGVQ